MLSEKEENLRDRCKNALIYKDDDAAIDAVFEELGTQRISRLLKPPARGHLDRKEWDAQHEQIGLR